MLTVDQINAVAGTLPATWDVPAFVQSFAREELARMNPAPAISIDWAALTSVVNNTDATQFQPASQFSAPLKVALDRLKELRKTPPSERWPMAKWPSEIAFQDAERFLKLAPLNLIPLPEIHLAADGEVNFLWKQGNIHVDLGFYGDGLFSFYAESDSARDIYGDDLSVEHGVPDELIAVFTS